MFVPEKKKYINPLLNSFLQKMFYISHKDGFSLSLITRTVYLHIQESKEKKLLYCFIFLLLYCVEN